MSTTPSTPALPDRPTGGSGRRRNAIIAIVVAVVVVLGAGGFALGHDGGSTRKTVTIGTTEASEPYWTPLKKLAADHGIDIKLVSFSDYTQANPALAQGQTDLNLFQHLLFLASYNVKSHQHLTPIGSTVVVPLGLYSKKHTSLSQIPRGGKVAIPNDPTNQARALLVLQQAGLVTLKDGGSVLSTPADVEKAASKVSVVPVDAAQTVTSLPSVDAAVINNNFALDAKLDPSKALYNDDPKKPQAQPYINAFVARAADKDNPTYLEIARLYHAPTVVKAEEKSSKGTAVVVDKPRADLVKILDGLETTLRKSNS